MLSKKPIESNLDILTADAIETLGQLLEMGVIIGHFKMIVSMNCSQSYC